MSQPPTPYERTWSFTDFSQSNPTTPHQGQKIDQELNNVQSTLNDTIDRLNEIQTDDGKVRNTALNMQTVAEEVEVLLSDAPIIAVNAAGDAKIAEINATSVAIVTQAANSASSAATSASAASGHAASAGVSAASAAASAVSAADYASSFDLSVGIVTTGAPGSQASVTVGGTAPDYLLSFTIPQGIQGPAGVNTWGSIGGTLSSQVDLDTALGLKAPLASPTFSGTISVSGTIPGTETASVIFNQNISFNQFVNYPGSTWFSIFSVQPTDLGSVNSDVNLSWGHRSTWYKGYEGVFKTLEIEPQGIYFDGISNNNRLHFSSDSLIFTKKITGTPVGGKAGINIGIGGTSTSATTQGDLWIPTGGANLNFRDGTGAWKVVASLQNGNVFSAVQSIDVSNNTLPALRVTQRGTGNALVVEDSTTPDATSLVVDNDGKFSVGGAINAGAAPHDSRSTFYGPVLFTNTGTFGSGSIKFRKTFTSGGISTASFSVAPDQAVITNGSGFTNGNFDTVHYPNEIVLIVNGSGYAIPARSIPLLPG